MNNYVIETEGLTKLFNEHHVVDNVSIHVPQGKIYGLLGRNGAGKTTAIRMIMGLLNYQVGTIKIFGKDNKKYPKEIYPRIGSIIETPGFYGNLTAKENLEIMVRLMGMHRKDAVEHALTIVNLQNENKKTVSQFSLGMKQRLGIARALLHEPELLVLDEPTNGLDPIGIKEMRTLLISLSEEKGITILISSHILNEIEQMANHIGIINEGKLLQEIDMNDIHKINKKYTKLVVSDSKKAAFLFERELNIKNFAVQDDNSIRVYDVDLNFANINRALMNGGIDVMQIAPFEDTLEDYFTKLTGGNGIG
jgi:bacitracin transport system ATP-binding protein